jgi:hypothetical protein
MDLHKITQGTLSMQLNVIDCKTMAMMVDVSEMPIADTDIYRCDCPVCRYAVVRQAGSFGGRFCEMQYESTVAQTILAAQKNTKQDFEASYRSVASRRLAIPSRSFAPQHVFLLHVWALPRSAALT